jgi:hypothetical protein
MAPQMMGYLMPNISVMAVLNIIILLKLLLYALKALSSRVITNRFGKCRGNRKSPFPVPEKGFEGRERSAFARLPEQA